MQHPPPMKYNLNSVLYVGMLMIMTERKMYLVRSRGFVEAAVKQRI